MRSQKTCGIRYFFRPGSYRHPLPFRMLPQSNRRSASRLFALKRKVRSSFSKTSGPSNSRFYGIHGRYNIHSASAVKRNLSKRCLKVFRPLSAGRANTPPELGLPRVAAPCDVIPTNPEKAITRTSTSTITMEEDEGGPHYSPISPSPGILGRLSVDSSGGSRKPAHEQSKSDETTRKIAAAHTVVALMQ